jgi:uncharacterized protein (TIGR02246 family)
MTDMATLMKIAALAAIVAAAPATAAAPSQEERRALEMLASRTDTAWNARDAAAMSGYYSADGNLKLSGMAKPLEGRAAIRNFMDRAFAQRQGEMRHVTVLRSADLVGPNIAFTDSDVRVERRNPDGSHTLLRTFENHAVVVRENGDWRLHAVRAHALPDPKQR